MAGWPEPRPVNPVKQNINSQIRGEWCRSQFHNSDDPCVGTRTRDANVGNFAADDAKLRERQPFDQRRVFRLQNLLQQLLLY